MNFLIDTHLLLRAAASPGNLSASARGLLEDAGNELFFSAVNIWEIIIKRGLGRSDFRIDPGVFRRGLIDNGYTDLPITSEHTLATTTLPPILKDPFDRILIAQAMVEGFTLLTSDSLVAKYQGPVRLI